MNCKNCQTELVSTAHFCQDCGAKVVTERLSTHLLIKEFFANYIGWDNSFIATIRDMIIAPQRVVESYLSGVRKRYLSPFIFVALGTALAMLIFNAFSEEYLSISSGGMSDTAEIQLDLLEESFTKGDINEKQFEIQKYSLEMNEKLQLYFLKYFNIFTFLILPFYALLSFFVFGKKLHYGEHLVINCYLQGFSFFIGIFIFLLSIYTNPFVYYFQVLIIITYYLYTYAKVMHFGFGKTLVKLLLFIAILIGLFIFIVIAGVLIGLLIGIRGN